MLDENKINKIIKEGSNKKKRTVDLLEALRGQFKSESGKPVDSYFVVGSYTTQEELDEKEGGHVETFSASRGTGMQVMMAVIASMKSNKDIETWILKVAALYVGEYAEEKAKGMVARMILDDVANNIKASKD